MKKIDLAKLRAAIRHMDSGEIYCLLDKAVGLLSQQGLRKLIKGRVRPSQLEVEGDEEKVTLLQEVRAFQKASLRGDYYEEFDVNWKNCSETSRGTDAWIADFHRLLDDCLKMARAKKYIEVKECFAILFSLLEKIDESLDILFYADEGGSWMVGIDWSDVLPAWYRCLAATSSPEEYSREVSSVVKKFVNLDQEWSLAAARRAVNPDQRRLIVKMLKVES